MPRNKKLFTHKDLIEISFRTEEGLPLVCTPYIETILTSILARAQTLFPITLCHYITMLNHLHMLTVVEDPQCVPGFVGYIKRESAHAINRLLGRKKHTIWGESYDSPVILDPKKAIDRIVYLYTNPQRGHLEETIDLYPGVSSWKEFLAGGGEREVGRITRDSIPQLPRRTLSLVEQAKLTASLKEESLEEYTLTVDPDAWLMCFSETMEMDRDKVNEIILHRVRKEEKEISKERKNLVKGAHALKLQAINTSYQPKKRGKKMICLSSFVKTRIKYLSWYRGQCQKLAEAKKVHSAVDWRHLLPPGFFAPGGALFANIYPDCVPAR